VQLLAASFRALASGQGVLDGIAAAGRDPLTLALSQAVAFGVAIYVGSKPPRMKTLTLEPPPAMNVLGLAIVAGIALQLPLTELGNALAEGFDVSHAERIRRQHALEPDTAAASLTLILAVVVVSPVTEELLFRGILLPGLARRVGTPTALLTSSALFGVIHGSARFALVAFAAGIVLGAVRIVTRSTWACVAVHAASNAVPILVQRDLLALRGFNVVESEITHVAPLLVLGSLATCGAALAAMRE